MATHLRRSSSSGPQSSSMKRSSVSEKPSSKGIMAKPQLAKKRPPLANITNQRNGVPCSTTRAALASKNPMVPCGTKNCNTKKKPTASSYNKGNCENCLRGSTEQTSRALVSPKKACIPRDSDSVSLDETMSICDSFSSPEFEYINNDVSVVNNVEQKAACSSLSISDDLRAEGDFWKRDTVVKTLVVDEVVEIDDNVADPQLCATIACEIYENLRASEIRKRPCTDFMGRIQTDINASMRSILIDWLVEVAEEYRLVPETLFLAVNYIDRYLSGNVIKRHQLQLLGVSSLMIAAKYEEICAPTLEDFCHVTDFTYSKEEVLEMESTILNYLGFEMTATTTRCFLRRFVRAAQVQEVIEKLQSVHLECLASYLMELSLLEYSMLHYAPSLIAASATFLANFILNSSKRPWTPTLRHYTLYKPSDLCECVKAIHRLCCYGHDPSLPAVREKYSQHKYKFVAKKYCPPSIPHEFFDDQIK